MENKRCRDCKDKRDFMTEFADLKKTKSWIFLSNLFRDINRELVHIAPFPMRIPPSHWWVNSFTKGVQLFLLSYPQYSLVVGLREHYSCFSSFINSSANQTRGWLKWKFSLSLRRLCNSASGGFHNQPVFVIESEFACLRLASAIDAIRLMNATASSSRSARALFPLSGSHDSAKGTMPLKIHRKW